MERQKGLKGKVHNSPIWIIGILAVAVINFSSASGQIVVEPMMMEFSLRGGETLTRDIEIQSTTLRRSEALELKLLELSQDESGAWITIEPNSGNNTLKLSSCREWIKLSASTINVKPLSKAHVTMTLKAPTGTTRSFYGAAVVVQTTAQSEVLRGVVINVQYVVPILVEISGKSMRA